MISRKKLSYLNKEDDYGLNKMIGKMRCLKTDEIE